MEKKKIDKNQLVTKAIRAEDKRSWIDELAELLDESGMSISFDTYRDTSKGCGFHCKAWVRGDSQEYCVNHKLAIKEGKYKPKN